MGEPPVPLHVHSTRNHMSKSLDIGGSLCIGINSRDSLMLQSTCHTTRRLLNDQMHCSWPLPMLFRHCVPPWECVQCWKWANVCRTRAALWWSWGVRQTGREQQGFWLGPLVHIEMIPDLECYGGWCDARSPYKLEAPIPPAAEGGDCWLLTVTAVSSPQVMTLSWREPSCPSLCTSVGVVCMEWLAYGE